MGQVDNKVIVAQGAIRPIEEDQPSLRRELVPDDHLPMDLLNKLPLPDPPPGPHAKLLLHHLLEDLQPRGVVQLHRHAVPGYRVLGVRDSDPA